MEKSAPLRYSSSRKLQHTTIENIRRNATEMYGKHMEIENPGEMLFVYILCTIKCKQIPLAFPQ